MEKVTGTTLKNAVCNSSAITCEHGVKYSVGCIECAEKHKDKFKEEDILRLKQNHSELEKDRIKIAFKNSGIEGVGLTRYFSNYKIYDEKQNEVVDRCKNYAIDFKNALKNGSSLVFIGKFGSGKTHIASAIAKHVMNCGYKALFRCAYDIFDELNDTQIKDYVGPGKREIIKKYTLPDLLIIDEIGVQGKTEFEERTIFRIINNRVNLWKPVILLSNCTSGEIVQYIGMRSLDRLKEGSKDGECVLTFDWPSYRSRVAGDPKLSQQSAVKYI